MIRHFFTFIFLILLFTACNISQSLNVKTPELDWLVGSWVRDNEEEGKQTYENWTKVSKGVYLGHGCTILDADTVFSEEMIIKKEHGTWALKVSGPNELPVLFHILEFEEKSFVSNCPENEFPKTISYEITGEKLKAIIADGTTEIDFLFSRIKNIN